MRKVPRGVFGFTTVSAVFKGFRPLLPSAIECVKSGHFRQKFKKSIRKNALKGLQNFLLD